MRLRHENEQLHVELDEATHREAELLSQIHGLESAVYNMQRGGGAQEADEEALAAEMAEELRHEMPDSARPGNITPSLGSGRLGVVKSPPLKPSCIPSLDMVAIEAAKVAEAEADAANAAVEPGGNGSAADGDSAAWASEHDDGDEWDGDADDNGIVPPKRPPPDVVPSLALGGVPRASYQVGCHCFHHKISDMA